MKSRPEKNEALTAATDRASSEVTQVTKQGFNMANSTVVTTNVTTTTPDLVVVDGRITTTSLQIAEHFGKRHKNVMQAISNLDCSAEFNRLNFQPVEYLDAKGEKRPCYRITRDGFVFLAMGFTGKEAAQWKEAYITAFNSMEAELRAKEAKAAEAAIDYTRISPAQAQDLREIVKAIVDAGIQTYGETWARFQRKFQVNSYLQLPGNLYEEARAYLIAKLPAAFTDAEVHKKVELADHATIQHAFSVATEASVQVQRAVFEAITTGHNSAWRRVRYLLSFGLDREGRETIPQAIPIAEDQMVCSLNALTERIAKHDISPSDSQLAALAAACTQRLIDRAQARERRAIRQVQKRIVQPTQATLLSNL